MFIYEIDLLNEDPRLAGLHQLSPLYFTEEKDFTDGVKRK